MPRRPTIVITRRCVATFAVLLALGAALLARPAAAQDSGSASTSSGSPASGSSPSGNDVTSGGLGPTPPSAAGGTAAGLGGLLPNVGAGPRVGDLRSQLLGYLSPQGSTAARPAWVFSPSIEVDLGVTDNVQQVQAPRRADVFLLVTPQIVISGDTANTTVNLSYAPQFTVYAQDSAENQVYQVFNGQALAELVPQTVFLDLRGSISQGSLTGVNQVQTQGHNTQNDVQTISFEVSPYATQRFGGWGTGTIRYAYNGSYQSLLTNQVAVNTNQTANALGQPGYGTLGNLSTNTETANFTTGENFSRVNLNATADASQYAGSLSADSGHREDADLELTYALNHKISLLSGIGYQVIDYGSALNGTTGYNFSGVTYNVGFTYTPNPDTSLTVKYGRHDGSTEVNFDAEFAPTSRTRFVARYTNGITTDLQQAQAQLNATTVGPNGALTDSVTGAPVLNNSYGSLQNSVYKDNRFSATLLYLQERDSYSIGGGYEQRTTLAPSTSLLGNTVVPTGTNTSTTFVNASWQHDLAPDMTFNANVQYGLGTNTGTLIGTGNQNTSTLSLGAVLTKQFTATLSGSVRYTYTDQIGAPYILTNGALNGFNTGTYSQNVFLVGLHKSF